MAAVLTETQRIEAIGSTIYYKRKGIQDLDADLNYVKTIIDYHSSEGNLTTQQATDLINLLTVSEDTLDTTWATLQSTYGF